ncbi:MAG: arylsulfatase [Hyphomonadaceae bacterium]|nr:arylsulfatase [Hyphomonadaceae bacterium]
MAVSACSLLLGCQETTGEKTGASDKPIEVSQAIRTTAAYEQPNIVILLADDLGWADLGFRGSDIETPNIDKLARDGLILNRFYAMPICTPTRSALMTARDPMKLGSIYAGFQPWQNGGVSPDEHFMPETFKAAGYQTAMVGKWHLGHTIEPLVPNSRGFDHFFGHLITQIDYFDYTVANGYDLQENGASVRRDGQYMTDVHGAEAVRYLEKLRDPDKPFFLYVPFLAPHSPMQAPAELEDKYKTRQNRPFPKRTYAAMVDSLDQAVGEILDSLEAQGLAENTLVFFFSDNGGLQAFGADNSPYRGGKLQTFEGGVRVNALMRWPGHIEPGTATDDVVSVLDVFPTFANAAGVSMGNSKELDGQDRWQALMDTGEDPRTGDLYFASNSPIMDKYHVSVLEERWKLVQIIDHKSASTDVQNFLFDINADPAEKKNLAETNPEDVARMADKIRKWRALHPINGVKVALAPHPGWRAPKDYAKSVIPASELQEDYLDSYTSGMRGKILQKRHGDKGRLSYE